MTEVVFVEEVNVFDMRHEGSCQSIADAFDLQGAEATQHSDKIAALLTHSSEDLTWGRRPSVLEQLRGWQHQPVVREQTKQPDLKAVA
jgi:hypothetical protein